VWLDLLGIWIDSASGIGGVLRWLDPAATNDLIGLVMSALIR
jgi:hypothetical protein